MSSSWVFEAADATWPEPTVYPELPVKERSELSAGLRESREGLDTILIEMSALGLAVDGLAGPIGTVNSALTISLGGYEAYRGLVAAAQAARAAQAMLASAEGGLAAADPLAWGNLLLAGASMAAVYAGFQFASGSWSFPAVDLADPVQRDRAAQQLAGVNHG